MSVSATEHHLPEAMSISSSAIHPGAPRLPGALPGLALTLLVAAAAAGLARLQPMGRLGLSALALAIVLGMALGHTVYPRIQDSAAAGVDVAKGPLLRLGVALFGLRLTFAEVAAVGASGLLADAVMLCSTFALACWAGRRWFGLDATSSMLIGAGSSICGAAAVLATGPVVRGTADQVAVAVATVVVFGTLAMFGYPLLLPLLQHWGMPEAGYGVWVGSTIHEVAQVIVAGRAGGELAADQALIAKMLRVMMLAPFLLLLSMVVARRAEPGTDGGRDIAIPWFSLWFVGMVAVQSTGWLGEGLTHALLWLDELLLAMAMGALGLTTHVSAIRRAGRKPLLLALVLALWLLLGGVLVNGLLGRWWF